MVASISRRWSDAPEMAPAPLFGGHVCGPNSCRRVGTTNVSKTGELGEPLPRPDPASAVNQDPAEVLASVHVRIALVDGLQRVSVGDEFIELQRAGLIHRKKPQNIFRRT